MKAPIELRRSYRLLNHGPTTLVTSAHAGKRNVMAAAWVMALDFDPPKVAAVIAEDTYTRELVVASGEFGLSLPTRAMLDAAYAAGKSSGKGRDKIAELGFQAEAPSKIAAPLIAGCAGWLECKVLEHFERYDLFIGEVVAAWADDRLFVNGEFRFETDEDRTVHHLAGGAFFMTGSRVQAKEP